MQFFNVKYTVICILNLDIRAAECIIIHIKQITAARRGATGV